MKSDLMQWFQSEAGQVLLQQEAQILKRPLANSFADVSLQIGGCPSPLLTQGCHSRWIFYVGDMPESAGLSSIKGALHQLPLKPESVDLIVLPHTLDLISVSPHFVKQMVDALTPGGELFVLAFNPNSLCQLARAFGIRPGGMPTGSFQSPRRWRHLLEQSGLMPLKQCYVPCYWPGLDNTSRCNELLTRWAWASLGCVSVTQWRKRQWQCGWVGNPPMPSALRPSRVMGAAHRLGQYSTGE